VVHRGAPTATLPREESAGEGEETEGEAEAGAVVRRRGAGSQAVRAVRKAVFAVVQVGSHQFKVSPGDVIYTEKLLFADLNDTVHLDKVLLLGSRHETVIGRPSIPGAHAVALARRAGAGRQGYRVQEEAAQELPAPPGPPQELTRLFIVDIHGIEEPSRVESGAGKGAGTSAVDAEGPPAAVGA